MQLEKKVGHWDIAVREITASALHNLALVSPDKAREKVLTRLVASAESSSSSADLFLRHGSILASGFVVSALAEVAEKEGKPFREALGEDMVKAVGQVRALPLLKFAIR